MRLVGTDSYWVSSPCAKKKKEKKEKKLIVKRQDLYASKINC